MRAVNVEDVVRGNRGVSVEGVIRVLGVVDIVPLRYMVYHTSLLYTPASVVGVVVGEIERLGRKGEKRYV